MFAENLRDDIIWTFGTHQNKVRVEDRQEICEDFQTIHQATDAEAAEKSFA